MSARSWGRFVSSLLTVRHPVHVTLDKTNIDADTVGWIQTFPHFTVTQDLGMDDYGNYPMLKLTTSRGHSDRGS